MFNPAYSFDFGCEVARNYTVPWRVVDAPAHLCDYTVMRGYAHVLVLRYDAKHYGGQPCPLSALR